MNKYFFLFSFGVFFALISFFSFSTNSFAQSDSDDTQVLSKYGITILVQTFVHNSEGKLVTYLASDKFSFVNLGALTNLLNFEESKNDPIISFDEKKYQVITRRVTIPYEKENVIASTIIAHSTNGTLNMVARFAHDGYPLISGDKVTTIWTFMRPIG